MVLKIQQRFRQIRRGEHWRHGHGRESPEGEVHLDKPELGYTMRSRLPGFVARPEPLADLRGCYSPERPSRLLLYDYMDKNLRLGQKRRKARRRECSQLSHH